MAHHKPGHQDDKNACYVEKGKSKDKEIKNCKLKIKKVGSLNFPFVVSGFSQVVTVAPSDAGAAVFSINGEKCARVKVEVVEPSIRMRGDGASNEDSIKVRDFTFGGSVSDLGTGVTDCSNGKLKNIRVGGTAHVKAKNKQTFYEGYPTIRIVYY